MSNLYEAVNMEQDKTYNGAKTLSSSLNKNVDYFFLAGAMRGKDITPVFAQALAEDVDTAMRITQWMRDVRGGAGERKLFRDCLQFLEKHSPELASKLIKKVPEIGRWDDLLVLKTPELKNEAYAMIAEALEKGDGLCAKWMKRKGEHAVALTKYMKLSPKQYRKKIVGLTKVVEQQMSKGDWKKIEYSKVPSVAAGRYQKAFDKHDPEGYSLYRNQLISGEAKVNAGAVYPHDVIKSMNMGDKTVSVKQWESLPNFMEGSDERIMPVVDVSGSMNKYVGGSTSISCMDVAVALGLYISERNEGIFKDHILTFSSTPTMEKLSGDLFQRYTSLRRAHWGTTTDIQATFKLILDSAIEHDLKNSDLPDKVLILSDMEFNNCGRNTNFQAIEKQYEEAGYMMPELVFWNLHGRMGNVPVRYDQGGVALVSGFSPSILKPLMKGELNPVSIMEKTVNVERYDF